jgi:hypothetical protein
MLHENILRDSGIEEAGKAKGLVMALSLRDAELDSVLADAPDFARAPTVGMCSFPDIVIPGEYRYVHRRANRMVLVLPTASGIAQE